MLDFRFHCCDVFQKSQGLSQAFSWISPAFYTHIEKVVDTPGKIWMKPVKEISVLGLDQA